MQQVSGTPSPRLGYVALNSSKIYLNLQVETAFNRKAGYPWVFLNDEPFTET